MLVKSIFSLFQIKYTLYSDKVHFMYLLKYIRTCLLGSNNTQVRVQESMEYHS